MREPIAWNWLGLCAYDDALALQERAWHGRRDGGPDRCLVLEHPPTITVGRRATVDDLRIPTAALGARGIAFHRTERGGGATYHAPGQLVIYPIVDLAARGLGVRRFVTLLEAIMLDVAASVGVAAHRDPRGPGIWTRGGKLGAVGIRVRNGITSHGLALNVAMDLDGWASIAPCSMPGLAVTDLRREGAAGGVRDLLPAARLACERRLDDRVRARAAEACA